MKKLFKNYSLDVLNTELHSIVRNNKVNNLKMFVSTEDKSKISVTLKPDLNFSESFHGLHPIFDEEMLKCFLGKLGNHDAGTFWNLVNEFQNYEVKLMNLIFVDELHNKKKLEISLLGKAILQMASHFGYIINCSNNKELYNELKEVLKNTALERYTFWDYSDPHSHIKILGIWPESEIEKLSLYTLNPSDNNLLISKAEYSAPDNITFHSLLSFSHKDWQHYFKLLTSDIYYSGVMPCVKKIDYEINPYLSGKVKYLVFHVVRTTYATVDTFDNSQILVHPFFHCKNHNEYYDYLLEFDLYEDSVQEKYLYSEDDNLEKLNMYLSHSLNTHTVAVSANLITSDGYLIAAKRGSLNIDAGEFYCSANGQTEFRDENVSFYRKSVFEDMPTMDYFSKYRVDITNEIQRECIAELGITSFSLDWICYGISYLSINNTPDAFKEDSYTAESKNSKSSKYRRMHFNVLMSNSISYSFKEVDRFHKNATESFENESLIGIKSTVFQDKTDLLKSIFLMLYKWIDENKSRIFMFLIIISILTGKKSLKSISLSDYIDFILITVYTSISLLSFVKNHNVRKRMIRKYYYLPVYLRDKNQSKMKCILDSLMKKTDGSKFHAIFSIMYILYFLSLIEDDN